MSESPKVNGTNERMVFEVASDTKVGVKYRVDLLANNGAGACACRDYETRRGPALKRGEAPWSREGSCKHMRRAAWYFLRELLPVMAESERPKRNNEPNERHASTTNLHPSNRH